MFEVITPQCTFKRDLDLFHRTKSLYFLPFRGAKLRAPANGIISLDEGLVGRELCRVLYSPLFIGFIVRDVWSLSCECPFGQLGVGNPFAMA
jgi:hypothetical protein